jgi:hypothetical protein
MHEAKTIIAYILCFFILQILWWNNHSGYLNLNKKKRGGPVNTSKLSLLFTNNVLNVSSTLTHSHSCLKTRNQDLGKIAIAVSADSTGQERFRNTIRSVQCYALKHGYDFILVDNKAPDTNYSSACHSLKHDLEFWRHCMVLHTILPFYNWVVLLDGDVGVFNANKCLENLVTKPHQQSIIHEERFHNGEIQAGSYMIKNDEFGRAYLENWIGYKLKGMIPNADFTNSDNGVIHILLLKYYNPSKEEECMNAFRQSHDLEGYDKYVGCCMKYISSSFNSNIRIIRRGHGFVRDLWVTENKVSLDTDFFLHAIKENTRFFDTERESEDQCGSSEYEPKILLANNEIQVFNHSEMKHIMYNAEITCSSQRPYSYIPSVFIRDCWPYCPEYTFF